MNKPFRFPQHTQSLIRAGSGCLPAGDSLGSVLQSQGKTELQRGHICHESTPSLLSIYSPFSERDGDRSFARVHAYRHAHVHA